MSGKKPQREGPPSATGESPPDLSESPPESPEALAESLTYEQARDELAEVVRRLEAGDTTLEQSLALWERGEQLATICEEWLQGARARLAEATAASREGPAGGAESRPHSQRTGE